MQARREFHWTLGFESGSDQAIFHGHRKCDKLRTPPPAPTITLLLLMLLTIIVGENSKGICTWGQTKAASKLLSFDPHLNN